jgi:hypoxanthine phosphoribosyltransferase
MVNKVHYTWKDIEHMIQTINNMMFADNWRPDYIVGLTRGGLVPATIMSNMTGIMMHALDVRFRDTDLNYIGPESNCWMAEDAFGYVNEDEREVLKTRWDITKRKKILIIDDINDSGKTLNWIRKDWESSCFPDERQAWDSIWGNTVKVATLIDNVNSSFGDVDYTALEIDKEANPVWVVYPWEGERDYGNF